MKQNELVDHLFRHQHGKMVSVLTRIFGFHHLEMVEDAVQDTFVKAVHGWKQGLPDNPEAWLFRAAKNRIIDLLRAANNTDNAIQFDYGTASLAIDELFLEHEVEDSELRMIFAACHPELKREDQIAFALKTVSGFGVKEIAVALLSEEERIKKRLQRAKKTLIDKNARFHVPIGHELQTRLDTVFEVLYALFNEGFHSAHQEGVVRKDICGEAMRLIQMLLKREWLRSPRVYALFALMCFHSARLESKVNSEGLLLNMEQQDRSLWYQPLINLGNGALERSMKGNVAYTSYHCEAAIAGLHANASNFDKTNWKAISSWYEKLYELLPSDFVLLNKAIVYLKIGEIKKGENCLQKVKEKSLGQRRYLYFATKAEFCSQMGDFQGKIDWLRKAMEASPTEEETNFFRTQLTSLEA